MMGNQDLKNHEALKALVEGKAVRLQHWAKGLWWVLDFYRGHIYSIEISTDSHTPIRRRLLVHGEYRMLLVEQGWEAVDGRSLIRAEDTVSSLLKSSLEAKGYHGLFNTNGECACLLPDIGPCCEINTECQAGVLGRCNKDTCALGGGCTFHIVERGHPDEMSDAERDEVLKKHSGDKNT